MLIEFGFFFEKKILYLLYKIYLNNCKMFRFDPAVDSEEYCSIITVQRYRIFTLKHYLALHLLTKCKNFEKKTFFSGNCRLFCFRFQKNPHRFRFLSQNSFLRKSFQNTKENFRKISNFLFARHPNCFLQLQLIFSNPTRCTFYSIPNYT